MTRTTPQPHFFHNLSLIITGSIATTALLVGLGLWRGGDRFWPVLNALVAPLPEAQQEENKVDVRSIVVQQVQGASELTTAVFAMQAVTPARRDRTLAGQTIGSTTLLYIGYGEVRAGVDLSQIRPEDVQPAGNTLQIRLPAPEILDSKIDVNRSTIYDYDRGFLGLGPDVAPDLQQQAQRETLQAVQQAACDQGILQQANERAVLAVRQLMLTAGYTDVVVETRSPNLQTCNSNPPTPPSLPTQPSYTPQG